YRLFQALSVYDIPLVQVENAGRSVLVCNICMNQIESPETMAPHTLLEWQHVESGASSLGYGWADGMRSRLVAESWSQYLLDMPYLDEEILAWAKAMDTHSSDDADITPTLDSNGAVLQSSDTVTLIKA
ncbi:MAG: PhnA protein, partial [Porticoccus sp.]|nr:PhnA protein [Porticoccus sp.]